MALVFAMLSTSCAGEGEHTGAGSTETETGGEPDTAGTTTSPGPGPTGDDGPGDETSDAGGTDGAGTGPQDGTTGGPDDGTTGGPGGGTDDGETSGPPFGTLPHEEPFEGPDGSPWPSPWATAGSGVVSHSLEGGRGRLVGSSGQVARMVLPGFTETDVDATVTVEFDDWTQQGFGLYVRQNGGALQETEPPGQGYAAYVEGGWLQYIGIWRETNGVEELLEGVPVPGGALQPGVAYRLRLQCQQEGQHTRLRTRIWPVGQAEPSTWHVDMIDDTPVLQGTAGSFALDVFNYGDMGGLYVDDLYVAEP